MTAATKGLARQRRNFRGLVVEWDDAAQVCCERPGCPGVLTCQDPARVPAVAALAGWRVVYRGPVLPVYRCGGCR